MNSDSIDVGQDSFLDIVANLVGILIILVVVVGAQAQSVWTDQASQSPPPEQHQALKSEIEQTHLLTEKLNDDHERMREQVREELLAAGYLEQQRNELLLSIESMKRDVKLKKAELDAEAVQALEQQAAVDALEDQFEQLVKTRDAVLADQQPQQETIDHYPTPIARTVFSEEVHFHLKDNRIAFVPLDALMQSMKAEWQVKADKLQTVSRTIETVPAQEGFRLQYELVASEEVRPTERGPVRQTVIQFRHFVILPTQAQPGEPISAALQSDSRFRESLAQRPARQTTVSIWVYPDSFEGFAELKSWLHENGFQSAAWPLSEGSLISGSPEGLRSSAQ